MSTLPQTAPISAPQSRPLEERSLKIRWLYPDTGQPWVELAGGSSRIGRAPSCEVQLDVSNVSREHAMVFVEDRQWRLRDLGSTNGTYCDGSQVEETTLRNGMLLRLGGAVGRVVERGPSEAEFGEFSPGIWGGAVLQQALRELPAVAQSELSVVLNGESGVGKECVAQTIHSRSGRRGQFVAINCASLPEAIAETELFGHTRGAFTGAHQGRLGHFRAADEGTLFLDEVLELPLTVQAKLLRAVEQRSVLPMGQSTPIAVNVRLVCASQQALREAVDAGRFRRDLWARLNGYSVEIPPVRSREEDAVLLFLHFLKRFFGGRVPSLEPRLVERVALHDWPLNVREIAAVAKRLAVVHGHSGRLGAESLPREVGAMPKKEPDVPAGQVAPGRQHGAGIRRPLTNEGASEELAAFLKALRENGGNVAGAASRVGISRQRAYRLLRVQEGADTETQRQASVPKN